VAAPLVHRTAATGMGIPRAAAENRARAHLPRKDAGYGIRDSADEQVGGLDAVEVDRHLQPGSGQKRESFTACAEECRLRLTSWWSPHPVHAPWRVAPVLSSA